MTVTQVAHAYQIDRTTLHRWLARYHKAGSPEGLARHAGSGRPRKLQEMTPEQWRAVILEPASAFGFETDFWTAKRVHQVITQQFGVSVAPQLLREHPRRHLVVVMDQAPPHTSEQTTAFIAGQRRLHVFHLPAYSPDWNPDEKVCNHLKHQEL
jgi:transposase